MKSNLPVRRLTRKYGRRYEKQRPRHVGLQSDIEITTVVGEAEFAESDICVNNRHFPPPMANKADNYFFRSSTFKFPN